MTAVRLTRRGAARWATGHPWIFRSDVQAPEVPVPPGELVQVADFQGRVLGVAAWSDRSEIAIRGVPLPPDADFEAGYLHLLDAAVSRRHDRPEACRLVNGDADGLPGLIVDRYGPAISLQTLTQSADRRRDAIVRHLRERLWPQVVALRNDVKVREYEGLEREKRLLHGTDPVVEAKIGQVTMTFDVLEGQKTGGFLDQTDNRIAAARFARGDCLDCFSYDGGFALHLAAAGNLVTAVDSSESALLRLERNARRNRLSVLSVQANVFDLLRTYEREGRRFDTIVLDPPAFARSRQAVPAARRAYKEINLRALKLLSPGGRLVTCTCSAHLTRPDFEKVVAEAAADAGRWVRVIERRSAAPDHPSLLTAPETDYLKVLFLEAT